LRYLTLGIFDPHLEDASVNKYIMNGSLSLQEYAASKWFQHLNALAIVYYDEEGFKIQDSVEALESLSYFMSGFLDRYANDIPDENVLESVKDDYAKLAGQDVYEDLTRVMSHVTRYMEKGPTFRSEICIPSLKKSFERNRRLIEKFSTDPSRTPGEKGVLMRYYGPKRFKCSFVTCIDFYEGFRDAKTRDKHVNLHKRPWICDVPQCTSVSFGFASNKDLEKHMRDYHPSSCDLSLTFNLPPKKEKEMISSKIVCHICGKKFSRNFHRASHIRSHMGDRPFKCTECGKAFTRDNDRKRHEKIHNKH
jgi:DNA-directed RNA polymerase subunit RPC12/RpoP